MDHASRNEPPETLSFAIHCFSCGSMFSARKAVGRAAWIQRLVSDARGQSIAARLCGGCASGFSSEAAALEFLDGVLENQLAEAAEGARSLPADEAPARTG
jgi:hypothetical protein